MNAAELISEVEAAGGRLTRRDGGGLHVQAPAPLPDELVERLRQNKAQLLALLRTYTRAASRSGEITKLPTPSHEIPTPHQDGIPEEWRKGLRLLLDMAKPNDIDAERWRMVLADATAFMQDFAAQTHSLGWGTGSVWGCRAVAPEARLDAAGLILCLRGRAIVAIDEDKATLRTASGKHLSFYRANVDTREQRLVWDESKSPF